MISNAAPSLSRYARDLGLDLALRESVEAMNQQYEGLTPYDLEPVFMLLLNDEQRASYQREKERRAALTEDERESEDYVKSLAYVRKARLEAQRKRRIRKAISAVVSSEDWGWYLEQFERYDTDD